VKSYVGAMSTRALTHLKARDPKLARWIDRIGAYALVRDELADLYVALARAIIYQQLNGKAAATIFGRVEALGTNGFPSPTQLLALEAGALRGAGVSGAKERALRDLAEHAARGDLPSVEHAHTLNDDVLIEKLTAVRGIGPWTVEMLLMFRLGRQDVLPATDYGVRQGFQIAYGMKALPSPKEILKHGERWRPYRSVASWYLWRVLESTNAANKGDAPKLVKKPTKKKPAKKKPAKKKPAKKKPAKKKPAKKKRSRARGASLR
jgi:DNA-3-methyladenine glycosylase II